MFLMVKNLAESEAIEVADIKLGDQCMEIHLHGALIEVPIYDEDENLDLASCARRLCPGGGASLWLRCSTMQRVASTPKGEE
jgi:hypothetical protein